MVHHAVAGTQTGTQEVSFCFFYLQKQNHYYYFRIRIPLDLQQWFDTLEIKRSLHTKNLSIAKVNAC